MFARSARFYDAIYAWKDYAAEAATVAGWIKEAAPNARTLLDVACGTGVHAGHLARSFTVEGLDLDPELLEIARTRNPAGTFHEADMRDIDLGKRFDAVTCLFSSIGYMTDDGDLERAIGAMARHLEPGGVLIVEGWLTPDDFEPRHVGAVFVDQPELKIARINDARLDGHLSSFTFHYLVGTLDEITSFTEDHVLRLYTRDEYEAAFTNAGLEVSFDPEALMGRGTYIGVKR